MKMTRFFLKIIKSYLILNANLLLILLFFKNLNLISFQKCKEIGSILNIISNELVCTDDNIVFFKKYC